MQEARPGVCFWQTRHPAWKPNDGWDELVTSYALDDGARLLVIDPLAPPTEFVTLAQQRDTAIVLTCPWHSRDSEALATELGVKIYAPPRDAGDTTSPIEATVYQAGDRLPIGVQAFTGLEDNDLVLWIESHHAVVAGDTLIDRSGELIIPRDWADRVGVDPEEVRESLLPLLQLEVEVVLPTHGLPTDGDALARTLAQR